MGQSQGKSGYCEDDDEDGGGILPSILPVRDELARGDLRLLYLGWLLAVGCGEISDEAMEPPMPPGMAELSGAQQSLADFLHLDPNLIATAAQRAVGQLLAETETITQRRNEAASKKAAADKLECETKEVADRLIYLKSIVGQKSNLWKSVIALTETSTPSNYATAVRQIIDLRDLANLENEMESFKSNLAGLRELRSRKSGLIARLDKEVLI